MQMLGIRGSSRQKVVENSAPPAPARGPAAFDHHHQQQEVGQPSAHALRLVYCDDKGKFKMDVEAVAALQLVKGPVGVVAVCGRARQGKSFILNQLLGRSSGFQVAATHRPCTKGLWMWSTPLKRTAPDGSNYSLVLLDTEGIDAYDQTGTYSTQIFSLAVLLSSMFVYNQMGGIDEAALDRLSLVTEMTKHIQVRASSVPSQSSAAELGQFSPHFLWLLRDFYLDLTEDGRRITPKDYLESALQPMPGAGKAITAKNDIRDSIRALFPIRECFTLVRPLNDERDLQKLDQIPMERMRAEFRAGLDGLTRFIFERTRPKQLGSTIMTGPMLALLTQSFLDAINAGAVPTIATSWQSVEENECRRAHDTALNVYVTAFGTPAPADEESMLDAHERALQAANETYGNEAVGVGFVRSKYEKMLHSEVKGRFDEYRHKVSMEAELRCVKALDGMEQGLRSACQAPGATYDDVVQAVSGQAAHYISSVSGPKKWQKLANFLQKGMEGPIHDFVKRGGDKAAADFSALALRYRTLEDKLSYTEKQAEGAMKDVQEWKRRYEGAMGDFKSSSENAAALFSELERKYSAAEEKKTHLTKQLEQVQRECVEWRNKYEHATSERRVGDERLTAEVGSLRSKCTAVEARLVAAKEQAESAKEEAAEWRRKHDSAVADARAAVERANTLCDKANKHSQQREDALRAELASKMSQKELELKTVTMKVEAGERRILDLTARMKEHEVKDSSQNGELENLKAELRVAQAALEMSRSAVVSLQRDLENVRQNKEHSEERLVACLKRLEDAEHGQRIAEQESRRASEVAEKAKEDAAVLERNKLEAQKVAAERLAVVERADRRVEDLQREKDGLAQEMEKVAQSEREAVARVAALERRIEEREREREREMEQLLASTQEQRANTIGVLEGLLSSERAARAEANSRAESLSLELQKLQGKYEALQQELTQTRLTESELRSRSTYHTEPASGGGVATVSHSKRQRHDATLGHEAMEIDLELTPGRKRAKSEHNVDSGNSLMHATGDGDSCIKNEDENCSNDLSREVRDYRKLTISKLKQALTDAGYGHEVLAARHAPKKDFLELYERFIMRK